VPGTQLCTYSAEIVTSAVDEASLNKRSRLVESNLQFPQVTSRPKKQMYETSGRILNIQPLSFRIALDDF
jgi:hypothetical protein